MTPVDSLFKKHDPANGQYGDCMRACVASILDLPADQVPHFCGYDHDAEPDKDRWVRTLDEFLEPRGLGFIEIPFAVESDDVEEFLQRVGRMWFANIHWTLLGKSRAGFNHVVVCHGGRIVHDPTYGAPHGIVARAADAAALRRRCGGGRMSRGPKIGNESSALQRVFAFIDAVRRYLGREPKRVILFAEDYDAIPNRPPALKPYELVRGLSVREYQLQPSGEIQCPHNRT